MKRKSNRKGKEKAGAFGHPKDSVRRLRRAVARAKRRGEIA